MTKKQFVLEKPRPIRDAFVALIAGGAALIFIDYLFFGTAKFLGFILAAIVIYLFKR